jgi:hypothetical protein
MTPLKQWMTDAGPQLTAALAKRCGTSVAYLNHLAAEASTKYRRNATVELATKIERHTVELARVARRPMHKVHRTDLVPACAECPHARKCLGAVAVRSDFPAKRAAARK